MKPDPTSMRSEEAARWFARLAAPDCSEQERVEFERWRALAPNARAYATAERLSAMLAGGYSQPTASPADPGRVLGSTQPRTSAEARLQTMVGEALGREPFRIADVSSQSPPRPRRRRVRAIPSAIAAGIVVAMLAVGSMTGWLTMRDEMVYAAADHDYRELLLEDGTRVHLDVGGEMQVQLSASERRIFLRSGRALFDVAHDAARPFVVVAGEERVTALGTVFQVHRRSGQDIVVTLAEGSVEVYGQAGGRPRTQRLSPGDQIRISADRGEWVTQRVDLAAATSWSIGRHVFRDVPLSEAVDEVNRYAEHTVVIADPTLAELPVSGSFVAGDTESIVAGLAAVLPLRVAESGDEILLFRRR